jgi:RNA polymerase sigma-70 factor (ECF subfamily)
LPDAAAWVVMDLNDESLLVEAITAGHTQRFEELVDIYKDKVFNMARHMTGSPQEAQDLAQEVFLLIYKNVGSFQGKSSLSTWIYRISLNRCLDWQRKQQRMSRFLIPIIQADKEKDAGDPLERLSNRQPTPEEQLIKKEQMKELHRAIQSLPEKYQKVIILYHFQQMTYQEIADILDLPVRTIETQLYRGKQKIREYLSVPAGKGVRTYEYV